MKKLELTQLGNFSNSLNATVYHAEPRFTEEITEIFENARKYDLKIALRGAGRSYNDAALKGGGIVLDLSLLNCVQAWDAETGILRAQPGLTLESLWQFILPEGWWPPVVSGTMKTTLGGCLGMNIHGKNNFKMGTIGENILEFDALLPNGKEVTCSPTKNKDLFYSMISGMGILGVFTSITMQMKRVYSGLVNVKEWNVPNLETQLSALLRCAPENDYIVGWLDGTARGTSLGRGQIHTANYLKKDEDPDPDETMRVAFQTLPDKFFGVVSKSKLHYLMSLGLNNLGVWGVNTAKYIVGRDKDYLQPHAAFHFLLDYVPDWEKSYGKYGLIQYQSFLPRETALDAWTEMLKISQQRKLPTYLGVTKRHRPDDFLISHAVDGFSLALDFKITKNNRAKLSEMVEVFDKIVLNAGGRFYFAKNSETSAETARAFLGSEVINKFRKLKKRCDPENLLSSDLYERVFGEGLG
ncbi:MAG: FAD-binding oxidoreductase [Anaerolineae bacterium]|jgi:decaprenylphospho-beta-D-ribofuranose 2-oxidase|nr:FAD-binding oxidoreductase [Anaerolineae bacterium]MBT7074966.1 FAD-binding oxidoreductase [Anaerolineae bacterium]MBT7782119.1 FAD-binding oxidoreductase [Anaerolineae bacterium]